MGKTVCLIRLSLFLPALLAGAPSRDIQVWRRLAVWWGLSYQMLDDLKDIHSHPGQTGKTAHRDGLLNRPNLALATGTLHTVHQVLRLVRLGDRALPHWSEATYVGRSFASCATVFSGSWILSCPPSPP